MIDRYPCQRCSCRVVSSNQRHREWDVKLLLTESDDQTQHFEPLVIIVRTPASSFKIRYTLWIKSKCHSHLNCYPFLLYQEHVDAIHKTVLSSTFDSILQYHTEKI